MSISVIHIIGRIHTCVGRATTHSMPIDLDLFSTSIASTRNFSNRLILLFVILINYAFFVSTVYTLYFTSVLHSAQSLVVSYYCVVSRDDL